MQGSSRARENLIQLLPAAIAWAESVAAEIAQHGEPLDHDHLQLAHTVGVAQPEEIRIQTVSELPLPANPQLAALAQQLGLLDRKAVGITFGYSVRVCHGYTSPRVFSHEFRHVHQYEQAGSIAAYIQLYLQQIIEHGYMNAPYEEDARSREIPSF